MTLGANYGLGGSTLDIETEGEATVVYPLGMDRHGNDVIVSHAKHAQADVVLTLYDAWCFRPDVMTHVRWLPYAPVDHEPLPEPVQRVLAVAWKPIAFSRFGEAQMRDAGLSPAYVPHGVDTDAYSPMNRYEARKALKLPEDKFVALMVAANKGTPSRKSFGEAIFAWSKWAAGRDDVLLFLHTHPGTEMGGIDLPQLLKACDVPAEQVMFCDPYHNVLGYPTRYMAQLYNAADVLLSPSMGEGFGVPIVEAQACGTPVIVGDWTSMPELCFSGWKVKGQPFFTPLGAWQFIPGIGDIIGALQSAYEAHEDHAVREKARKGALEYDADLVTERYWRPVLAEIADEIAEPDPLAMVDLS